MPGVYQNWNPTEPSKYIDNRWSVIEKKKKRQDDGNMGTDWKRPGVPVGSCSVILYPV